VSFAAPLVLLALLVVPALGVWYVVEQRRRARASEAFTSTLLRPSVAPSQPGWRRHLPYALMALALAALIVAVAKPQRAVSEPVKGATVMFANDVSNSMKATDVDPSRLVAAKRAATSFVKAAAPEMALGSIKFARHSILVQGPTTNHRLTRAAIAQLQPGGGGTAIGDAIQMALGSIRAAPKIGGKHPPGAVVLISDGVSNVGADPIAAAKEAKRRHVRIYTVSIGTTSGTIPIVRNGVTVTTRVPVNPSELQAIAAASGGRAYTAPTTAAVQQIYTGLAKRLGEHRVHKQLVSAVSGLALVLLTASIAASLLWFGRLT
jgi:Ca-activated chloride channel family protein